MTWAYVHLAVNHLPVILMPVSIAMLTAAWAKKSAELRTAGLAWMVVAAVAGGAAYLTGEPAEHVVEDLPAVSKDAIEEHEETALLAAVATGAAGFLALGAMVIGRGVVPLPAWILATTFVAALVAAVLMVMTANLGGRISHPEIRGPSATTLQPPAERLRLSPDPRSGPTHRVPVSPWDSQPVGSRILPARAGLPESVQPGGRHRRVVAARRSFCAALLT